MNALQTSRLCLSPLCEADWPQFLALQQDSAVMRYVSDPRSEEEIRAAFESRLPQWSPGCTHWLCLMVREKESGRPLGVSGYIQREPDIGEVGFLFFPAVQGKGYGTESLRAVCDFAFSAGGLRRLIATVTAGNLASRGALEKVGFRLEGELRENFLLEGKWHNDWIFGLLSREYRGS